MRATRSGKIRKIMLIVYMLDKDARLARMVEINPLLDVVCPQR